MDLTACKRILQTEWLKTTDLSWPRAWVGTYIRVSHITAHSVYISNISDDTTQWYLYFSYIRISYIMINLSHLFFILFILYNCIFIYFLFFAIRRTLSAVCFCIYSPPSKCNNFSEHISVLILICLSTVALHLAKTLVLDILTWVLIILHINKVFHIVSSNHGRLEEFQPTLFWTLKTHYLHNINLVSTCR